MNPQTPVLLKTVVRLVIEDGFGGYQDRSISKSSLSSDSGAFEACERPRLVSNIAVRLATLDSVLCIISVVLIRSWLSS